MAYGVDLQESALEFQDLGGDTVLKSLDLREQVLRLHSTTDSFEAVRTVLARILAATPPHLRITSPQLHLLKD